MDGIARAPVDFPRLTEVGSVSGAQPKILVVKADGQFRPAINEEEIYRRWQVCEDLVQQLYAKTVKRMQEGRVADLDEYVDKLRQWLEAQEWDGWKVTPPESRWMRDQIRTLVEAEMKVK